MDLRVPYLFLIRMFGMGEPPTILPLIVEAFTVIFVQEISLNKLINQNTSPKILPIELEKREDIF